MGEASETYVYPEPDEGACWVLALEIAALARDNALCAADLRFPTGPNAWLYLHAASPELRVIALRNHGIPHVKVHDAKKVVTTLPRDKKPFIMQTFSWAPNLPENFARNQEKVVYKAHQRCSCMK